VWATAFALLAARLADVNGEQEFAGGAHGEGEPLQVGPCLLTKFFAKYE